MSSVINYYVTSTIKEWLRGFPNCIAIVRYIIFFPLKTSDTFKMEGSWEQTILCGGGVFRILEFSIIMADELDSLEKEAFALKQ